MNWIAQVRMKPDKVAKVTVACCVLHNLAKLWGENEDLPAPEDPPQEQPPREQNQAPETGMRTRQHIANTYFG